MTPESKVSCLLNHNFFAAAVLTTNTKRWWCGCVVLRFLLERGNFFFFGTFVFFPFLPVQLSIFTSEVL
jgi:hypothetical protein